MSIPVATRVGVLIAVTVLLGGCGDEPTEDTRPLTIHGAYEFDADATARYVRSQVWWRSAGAEGVPQSIADHYKKILIKSELTLTLQDGNALTLRGSFDSSAPPTTLTGRWRRDQDLLDLTFDTEGGDRAFGVIGVDRLYLTLLPLILGGGFGLDQDTQQFTVVLVPVGADHPAPTPTAPAGSVRDTVMSEQIAAAEKLGVPISRRGSRWGCSIFWKNEICRFGAFRCAFRSTC